MELSNITLNDAVEVLTSLANESVFTSQSGDPLIARMGRTNLILSTVLLKMLSHATPEQFDTLPFATITASAVEEPKE